jgi:hypothetical protein
MTQTEWGLMTQKQAFAVRSALEFLTTEARDCYRIEGLAITPDAPESFRPSVTIRAFFVFADRAPGAIFARTFSVFIGPRGRRYSYNTEKKGNPLVTSKHSWSPFLRFV